MDASTDTTIDDRTANPRPPAVVDVLIPVYNGARTVESAIRSICEQTLADLRIVVVDDGSTDETPAILRRLSADDERIEVVTTANGGIVSALNVGLGRCTAKYVARHDADDLAFPERLQAQYAYMEANPGVVAVGCNAFHIDADSRRTGYTTEFEREVVGDPHYAPSVEPYLMHPFLFVRRQALTQAGGYRHAFHSEDTDLYWRLTAYGSLVNLPDVLGEYRLHPDSVSARSILNGRIAAVDSQRAALSERRRRDGKPDLPFDPEILKAYTTAESLRGILDVASVTMTDDERAWFELASVAKLLELSSYRPYRLTPEDLSTIRRCIEDHHHLMTRVNRRQLIFRVVFDRRRRERDLREVIRLVPWTVLPTAVWELATFMWQKHVGVRV